MNKEILELEIFDGKSISAITKELYTSYVSKKNKLDDFFDDTSELIQDAVTAVALTDSASKILDVGIKNDQTMIKVLDAVQKFMQSDGEDINSDLFDDFKGLDDDIEEVTKEVEEGIKSINSDKPLIPYNDDFEDMESEEILDDFNFDDFTDMK